jgi:hypothetical protein
VKYVVVNVASKPSFLQYPQQNLTGPPKYISHGNPEQQYDRQGQEKEVEDETDGLHDKFQEEKDDYRYNQVLDQAEEDHAPRWGQHPI